MVVREVCDDCLMVAYDEGVDEHEQQVTMMVTLGDELPDHMCILNEEDSDERIDGIDDCDCSCTKSYPRLIE